MNFIEVIHKICLQMLRYSANFMCKYSVRGTRCAKIIDIGSYLLNLVESEAHFISQRN